MQCIQLLQFNIKIFAPAFTKPINYLTVNCLESSIGTVPLLASLSILHPCRYWIDNSWWQNRKIPTI